MELNKAKQIVTIAYYTILNRPPDSKGLEHHAKLLVNNTMDEIDLAYALFTSKEYQSKIKVNQKKADLVK